MNASARLPCVKLAWRCEKPSPQAGLPVGCLMAVMASTGCQRLACMQMKETDTKRKAGKRRTRDDDDEEPEEAVRRGATRGGKSGGRR